MKLIEQIATWVTGGLPATDEGDDRHVSSVPFPPWSVKVILLWLLGFFFLSGIVGAVVALGLIYADRWGDLGWHPHARMFVGIRISEFTYALVAFGFVRWRLRKARSSIGELWGSKPWAGPRTLLLLAAAAAVLKQGESMLHLWLSGKPDIAPESLTALDWKFGFALDFLSLVAVVSIVEEILFRGLLYRALRRSLSFPLSAAISSSVFAAYHFEYLLTDMLRLTWAFAIGMISSTLLERSGSLTACAWLHALVNLAAISVVRLPNGIILASLLASER